MLDHLACLHDEVARFQAAIGDLDTPVPACPDWRVRDLVHHVGSVHRRFRRVAEEGWMRRPPPLDPDDRPAPSDDRITAWAEREAERLLVALASLDPAAPRWNFTTGPQVGAFIPRRMLHETTIHRWDLEDATGAAGPIREEVAIDGVHEYLEVLLLRSGDWHGDPAVVRTSLRGGPRLDLMLRPGEQASVQVDGDPTAPPDAILEAAPVEMLLAWWGRRPLTTLLTSGDDELITEVRRFART